MEVILQPLLDVLAVLLHVRLREVNAILVIIFVELHFEIALNDLVNFLTIHSIDQHAVL